MGSFRGVLGAMRGDWGPLGTLGDIWGICWGSLGRPWGYLGGRLDAPWALLGAAWDSLGVLGDACFMFLGTTMCVRGGGGGNCALNENIDKTCVFSLFLRS